MTYCRIPGHITGLYVFAVVNLCALLNISLVSADVYVIDVDNNNTVKTFPDRQAMFGPAVPDDGIVGRLVYANPHNACEPIQPPPEEVGVVWIALISRGPCHFDKKVWNAQQAKFSAAIVHNYEGEEDLLPMAGYSKYADEVKIPSVFVGYSEGMLLANNYSYTNKSVLIRLYEDDGEPPATFFLPFLVVCSICVLGCLGFVIVKLIRYFQHIRRTRLSKSALKKIPTRKFKKGEYFDSCAICLEDYEEGEKLRVLPCNHTYHCKCIDPWLTKRKKTCPQCKRRVIPGHDTESDTDDGDAEEGQGRASETTPLLAGGGGSGAAGGGRSSSSQGQRTRGGSLEQSAPGASTTSRGGRRASGSRGRLSLSEDGAEEQAEGQHVVVVIPNSDINTTSTTATTTATTTSAAATTTKSSSGSGGKTRGSSGKRKRHTATGREKREKEKRSSSGRGGAEENLVASSSAGVDVEEVEEALQGAVGGVGISDRKDFEEVLVHVEDNLPSTANTNNTLVLMVEPNQEAPAQATLGKNTTTATEASPNPAAQQDPESNPLSSENVLPCPPVGPQGSINRAFAASSSSEEEEGGGKKNGGSKGGLGIGARKKQRGSNTNSNDGGNSGGGNSNNNTSGGGGSGGNMVV